MCSPSLSLIFNLQSSICNLESEHLQSSCPTLASTQKQPKSERFFATPSIQSGHKVLCRARNAGRCSTIYSLLNSKAGPVKDLDSMSTASSQPSPAQTATPTLAGSTPSTSKRTSDEPNRNKDFSLDGIPRSASYTQFPATRPSDASFERNGIKRTFSENLIANPKANNFRHASMKRPSRHGEGLTDSDGYAHVARRLSTTTKPETKYTLSKFTLTSDDDEPELSYDSKIRKKDPGQDPGKKKRSVTGSISRMARHTWIGPSRSSSPNTGRTSERAPGAKDARLNHQGLEPHSISAGLNGSTTVNGHGQTQPQDSTIRRTKARRPLSSLMTMIPSEHGTPSVPPIPKSFSTDRLPLPHAHASSELAPSLPTSRSFERLQANGLESPRKKDELWNAFRALDGDFQKYAPKP